MTADSKMLILKLLDEGKITVEESERLLKALNPENDNKKQSVPEKEKASSSSEAFFNPFIQASKIGFDIKRFAQNLQRTMYETMKQVEPKTAEFKNKVKEFANWMEESVNAVADELNSPRGVPIDGAKVELLLPLPKTMEGYSNLFAENTFGSIKISEGESLKAFVTGHISKADLQDRSPADWLSEGVIYKENGKISIVLNNSNKPAKAVLDLDITLPKEKTLECRTVRSQIIVSGNFNVKFMETVSGNIRINRSQTNDARLVSVSGSTQLDACDIASLSVHSTSGDIIIRNSDVKSATAESVSGNILFNDVKVSIDSNIKTVSTSGDTYIENIEGPWKSLHAQSENGEINVNWQGKRTQGQGVNMLSGGEGANFTAKSVTGAINFL